MAWWRARLPTAIERRTSRDSVEPGEELLVGVVGDRGLQVQGVGEVEVPVHPDPAGRHPPGQGDVEVPGLGRREAFGLEGFGVEPGLGLLDQPVQLGRTDLVGHVRDVGVHERRRLG